MIEGNTGYATFELYMALKFHFTGKYDFFKYHGKVNTTKDNFMKRKDRYSFHKLSKKYDIIEMQNYMVSNFINDNTQWIGDISGAEGEDNYRTWLKTQQSLSYIFENDLI